MAVASIDVEGLALLILRLDTAASSLRGVCGELRPRARALHVPTSALTQVAHVAEWAHDQLPGLRRRLDLALVADAARPAALRGTHVEIEDPTLDAAQAEAAGRELAAELMAIEAEGEAGALQLRAVLTRLAEHLGDPDVMSGFYAELGVERTEDLPYLLAEIAQGLDLRDDWAGRGARDLEVLARGFATALHDSTPPPEFEDLVATFETRTDDHERAWARLALVRHGPVPTDHLVRIVQVNALEQFVDDPLGDVIGDVLDGRPAVLGLPRDRLELAFGGLAANPDAARRAISAGPGTAAMVERVYAYYRRFGVRVDEAFVAALAAGAGVDEPPGEHSTAAATFAFDVFTATADLGDTMWFAREQYAAIAAAWVPELLAGATAEMSRVDESRRARPPGWEDIPGVRPHFYLSLEDTRGFLETFGHSDELSAPFDRAVGVLYGELLTDAVAVGVRSGDWAALRTISQRFGNLSGAAYVAQQAARSALDANDDRARELLGTGVGLVLDQVLSPGTKVGWVLWEASKLAAGDRIDAWVDGSPGTSRAARHEQGAVLQTRLQEAALAHILLSADPDRGATLPDSLRSDSGGLLEPAAIMRDPGLADDLKTWLTSTNVHGEGTTYDLVVVPASRFRGGIQEVQLEFDRM